jgi:hypothetical protein
MAKPAVSEPKMPKSSAKWDSGKKKKKERDALKATLTALSGIKYSAMTKTQQEAFVTVLGQWVGLIDDLGAVKPLV